MTEYDADAIRARAAGDTAYRRDHPEGITVTIVTCPSEHLAREVAPLVARRLFPLRLIGGVLHCEASPRPGEWWITLADLGTASRPSQAVLGPNAEDVASW